MKSKTKFALALGMVLFTGIFLAGTVSALSSWQKWSVFNNLLDQSNDYDMIWEGPLLNGRATVVLRGGDSFSALSNLDISSGNFDVLSYQRNDIRDYNSRGYGSSRYNRGGYRSYGTPWYQNYWSSPTYNSRGYSGYGSRFNTGGSYFRDSSESLFIDNRLSNSVPRTNVYIYGNSNRNLQVRDVSQNKHPMWDSELGHYNWRYRG